ncbi:MAG: type IX secretion system sortase PorU [candidate division Zixibacteria bacterium]|nr:type IX secretion system sortase PorU [candidate division Zixibacteria bacterium]
MNSNLYKSFFIVFFMIIGPVGLLAADDIRVIASSEDGFHFKFICKDNLSNLAEDILSDSSRILHKYVKVGIPFGARVEIVSVEGTGAEPVALNDLSLKTATYKERPLVTVSSPVMVRNHQMVTVLISPLAGASVYREVEVELAFVGGERDDSGKGENDPVFERIFKAALANFDDFKNWSHPLRPALSLAAADVDHPLYKADTWYKMTVTNTGLYKVTGAQLAAAGMSLNNLSSDSIRIFNSGGLPLDIFNENPRPVFDEISIIVKDGGDGYFGQNDYILFYGEAPNRWVVHQGEIIRYVNNRITKENVYWLCTSGDFASPAVRMSEIDASATGAESDINTCWRRVRVEQDNFLAVDDDGHLRDYYRTYWSRADQLSFSVLTPGAVPGDSAYIYLKGRTNGSLSVNGYIDLTVNGVPGLNKDCSRFDCQYSTNSLLDGFNAIDLELTPISSSLPSYFDYMELHYHSYLAPYGGELDITLGDLAGRYRLVISDAFTGIPLILDMADPLHPASLVNYEQTLGVVFVAVDLEAGSHNRFYCTQENEATAPTSITRTQPTNLRRVDRQVDLFVVTPRAFISGVEEFVDYREAQGYSVRVVAVEDIMENFAYDFYDPIALRDFLKYAYDNYPTPAPSAVLFVGDANYDYMDRLETHVPNYVPIFLHPYSQYDYTYNDDNYVYFGEYGILDGDTSFFNPDRGYDMLTARWPVKSIEEIDVIMDKVKRYEAPANFGFWRNNIILVADDEHAGSDHTQYFHTGDTDTLALEHIPANYILDKIYMWEYPMVNLEKPEVNDKIVDAINSGALLVNYVGHGNPNVWAHEHVFQRTSDLPRLTNYDRLPLVVAASCEIGFFDDPKREGMGEDFLAWANGGAIGVLAAIRLVYASDNKMFNQAVYDVLLYNDSLTIGEAIYTAKLLRQYNIDSTISKLENDRAFVYLGDPCLKLGRPQKEITFNSYPDSLLALGRTRVSGQVLDSDGSTLDKNGILLINVYDSEREKAYWVGSTRIMNYNVEGPLVYRGSASITGGEFDFEFITPLDINYGGQSAKIITYAVFDSTDGIGLVDSIPISDSIVISTDTVGPVISYNFSGRSNFISGDAITNGETLEITLADSSGINLVGGLGHGITLEIDHHPENIINLSNHYEYDKDDFTSGGLAYKLEDLEPGEHHFKIKAWDNANNSSSVTVNARVVARGYLAINNLLNYPNPMSDITTFYFELTEQVEKFSLAIYTLSGKQIKNFNRYGLNADNYPNSDLELNWDGKDAEGDRVATGVYIYKATAVPVTGEAVESFGKIVVIN